VYRQFPALHEVDNEPSGFSWAQPNDADAGLLSLLRYSRGGSPVLAVFNFTPVPRFNCLAGVPEGGYWTELLNSDAVDYSGGGVGNFGGVESRALPSHDMARTLTLSVPPLGCLFLAPE
jgi:1,4-alpha-glucan branching enzyme